VCVEKEKQGRERERGRRKRRRREADAIISIELRNLPQLLDPSLAERFLFALVDVGSLGLQEREETRQRDAVSDLSFEPKAKRRRGKERKKERKETHRLKQKPLVPLLLNRLEYVRSTPKVERTHPTRSRSRPKDQGFALNFEDPRLQILFDA